MTISASRSSLLVLTRRSNRRFLSLTNRNNVRSIATAPAYYSSFQNALEADNHTDVSSHTSRMMSTRSSFWKKNPNPAAQAAAASQTVDWRKRPPNWGQQQQQQQQKYKKKSKFNRLQPKKYNSLLYLPGNVALTYPTTRANKEQQRQKKKPFELECLDFAIAKPLTSGGKTSGGHVLLGKNGTGKSLLIEYLSNPELLFETSRGNKEEWKFLHPSQIGHVSFESHIQMIKQNPNLIVHDAITGGIGNLSKAAKFLVVRFGIFPLLHRTISTLSTGEIRKTLLVSALCKEPALVILENPFDGLDINSRIELKSIVSKTIKGMESTSKLLVQGIDANNVPPAQVFMCTHRPEEIVDEISTVSLITKEYDDDDEDDNDNNNKDKVITIQRPKNLSQEQLMHLALGLDKDYSKNLKNWSITPPWKDEDPTLPSIDEIQSVWGAENSNDNVPEEKEKESNLISLKDIEIRRRRDGIITATTENEGGKKEELDEYVTLLHNLSWDINKGERWLIAGGNGAGKSTLSRFLFQSSEGGGDASTIVDFDNEKEQKKDCTSDIISGEYMKNKTTTIGWVSTESHLAVINNTETENVKTAWDAITHDGVVPESIAKKVIQWVFGNGDKNKNTNSNGLNANDNSDMITLLKENTIEELSQGNQKLALITSAIALRPKLLILDEPTQGLDWINRRRVLGLLERICSNTDSSLIYISHYQEEWIPSISHVLHLDKGHIMYQGTRKEYKIPSQQE